MNALAAFEQAIMHRQGEEDGGASVLADSMARRAGALAAAGRTREAPVACDEVIASFASIPDPAVEEPVADARQLKARLGGPD